VRNVHVFVFRSLLLGVLHHTGDMIAYPQMPASPGAMAAARQTAPQNSFFAMYDPNTNSLLVPMMPQMMGGAQQMHNGNVPYIMPGKWGQAMQQNVNQAQTAACDSDSNEAPEEQEPEDQDEVAPRTWTPLSRIESEDVVTEESEPQTEIAPRKDFKPREEMTPADRARRILSMSPTKILARQKQIIANRWRADHSALSTLNLETSNQLTRQVTPVTSQLTLLSDVSGLARVDACKLGKDLQSKFPSQQPSWLVVSDVKPNRQTSTRSVESEASTCSEGGSSSSRGNSCRVSSVDALQDSTVDSAAAKLHAFRKQLLAFRSSATETPEEVKTLTTGAVAPEIFKGPPGVHVRPVSSPQSTQAMHQMQQMQQMQRMQMQQMQMQMMQAQMMQGMSPTGSSMPPRQSSAPMMQHGTPFSRQTSFGFSRQVSAPLQRQMSEAGDIKRQVQSLLNKICPENIATIGEKLAYIEVTSGEDMEMMVGLLFKKALSEPHYSETYADLVCSLNASVPVLVDSMGEQLTFRKAVLNSCQEALAELSHSCVEAKDDPVLFQDRSQRMRALMRFIGNLFTRQLMPIKVVGVVLREMVLYGEESLVPNEHSIDAACELLLSVGHALEMHAKGSKILDCVCTRLLELKNKKNSDGRGVFPKRIQFTVQDLLETRQAQWAKKSFKSSAKTKEEIRMEQIRDHTAKSHGLDSPAGEVKIAGQRRSAESISFVMGA